MTRKINQDDRPLCCFFVVESDVKLFFTLNSLIIKMSIGKEKYVMDLISNRDFLSHS